MQFTQTPNITLRLTPYTMTNFFHHRRIRNVIVSFTLLALALLLIQHWGMMLSNQDDPVITRATMTEIRSDASAQGRFWLIPIYLMAQMPYQIPAQWGGWEVANLVKMAVNGGVFVAFVFFCMRLTHVLTGLLMGLVWLALVDVSPGEYSPFHGYLMMFNLQFAILFTSWTLYLKHLQDLHSRNTIILPFVLYAFALLAYEPMLFYVAVFPALFLYRLSQQQALGVLTWPQKLALGVSFARRNYLLAVVVLVYLVVYFAYRAAQPGAVRALDAGGSLFTIAKTTFQFSIHGLHLQFKPFANYLPEVLSQVHLLAAVLYGLVIGGAIFLLLPKIRMQLYPLRLFNGFALGVLVFFVASPNVLLSLTAKYQAWAEFDPHYVGSYFSSFPLAILITLLILYLVGGDKAKHERILFVAVLYVLASSAIDNYLRWAQLASTNRAGSELWAQAVVQLKNQAILREPSSTSGTPITVCGVKPPQKVAGTVAYWSRYLSEALHVPVTYIGKAKPSQRCTYRLDFDALRYGKN